MIIQSEERQIITAQDFEDASVEERKRFVPAPRSFGKFSILSFLDL